ncbi:MAG: 50S ribosomal protein L22 [Candidatus Woesearchaeota archaeon]
MKYAFKMENVGIAYGKNLPISKKHSYEIANYIRYKPVAVARKILKDVIDMKAPIPYRRYNRDLAHKRAMGSGRYPVKASKYILQILENAINNAKQKGMDENKLKILHISVHKGTHMYRRGRNYFTTKTAHVQIAVGYDESEQKSVKEQN